MPSKNSIRQFAPNTFYHVYNRGVAKLPIFLENSDYTYFLKLMSRYYKVKQPNSSGHIYKNFTGQLEINAFCLMSNHYHLLIYTGDNPREMTSFLRSLMCAYVQYFNKKYERVGGLFQGKYKASLIDNSAYIIYISRYIHRNPSNFLDYQYSSLKYYLNPSLPRPAFLSPDRILDMFTDQGMYGSSSYQSYVLSNAVPHPDQQILGEY